MLTRAASSNGNLTRTRSREHGTRRYSPGANLASSFSFLRILRFGAMNLRMGRRSGREDEHGHGAGRDENQPGNKYGTNAVDRAAQGKHKQGIDDRSAAEDERHHIDRL